MSETVASSATTSVRASAHGRNRTPVAAASADESRRLFAGRVSELVGSAGLAQDVQLRTLGLDRAAAASLPVQTPEIQDWLQAYADGVNAYLEDQTQPLPLEYGALEITRDGIPPWTPLDSLITAKGLAWNLSFDLEDIDRLVDAVKNARELFA